MPVRSKTRAMVTQSAKDNVDEPPPSSTTKRKPTRKSSPTWRRISSNTIRPNRHLFSSEPPKRSVRRFIDGDRNWPIRWPPASVSMPSRPPRWQRRAASPYARTTRAMSWSSISFGKARCAVSRIMDGPITGSQSPAYASPRRPRWVIWHMIAAPWRWMRSEKRCRWGTISSVPTLSWRKVLGLSGATLDEPPIIVRARPPLAFSS